MQFTPQLLIDGLNALTNDQSGVGRNFLLLDNVTRTQTCTINTTSNLLTLTGSAPLKPWVTGCRVRLTASGTRPAVAGVESSATADYYMQMMTSSSCYLSEELQLYDAVDFSSAGVGSISLVEQPLEGRDEIDVIVSREVIHPQYQRLDAGIISNAVLTGDRVARGTNFLEMEVETGQPTFDAGYVALLDESEGSTLVFVRAIAPSFLVLPGAGKKVLSITMAAI